MFHKMPATKKSIAMRKPVHGLGINDADYIVQLVVDGRKIICPAYRAWVNMLKRCYSKKSLIECARYTGCSVCDDWLVFSAFAGWHSKHHKDGYHLDKDLKVKGNKVYGPNTCLYVHQSVNHLLSDSAKIRGEHKIGVCFDKERGKFQAKVKDSGRTKNLGRFDTEDEAYHAYKAAKNVQIRIAMEDNPDIACYLEQHLYPLD